MRSLKVENMALFDCEHLLMEMIDSFDEVLFVDEKQNKIIEIKDSPHFELLHDSDDARKTFSEFKKSVYPDDVKKIENFNLFNGQKIMSEIKCRNSSSEYRWCYFEMIPVNECSYIALFLDLSNCFNEGIRMKTEIIDRERTVNYKNFILSQKYNAVIHHADIMVFEYDFESEMIHITSNLQNNFLLANDYNSAYECFLDTDIIYNDDKNIFINMIAELENVKFSSKQIRIKNNNNEYFKCNVYSYGIYDAGGRICAAAGVFKDVENKQSPDLSNEDKITDKMTGLLSSEQFCSDMKKILCDDTEKSYAMIMLDVEKFKSINELYGVEFGDEIIQFIAFSLKNIFNNSDQLTARFTSDFFGIFTYYNDEDELKEIIDIINSKISTYKYVKLKIAYGIYKVHDKSVQPRLICDYANIAKSTIKGNHAKYYAFYDEKIKNKILEVRCIEDSMESALKNGQFSMYLQPKYNIQTTGIIGAEALVRWNDPNKGLIMPDKFIPLFEKNGFIIKLDEYIWEQACITIRKWIDMGKKPIPISVNVSRLNVANSDLINILDNLVQKYDIDKKYLELEITETVYFDDQNRLIQTLSDLKKAGYTLLMDDFGAGFSSLNMLKNMPFDIIKIDRNFLNETMITDKGKKIIFHTISLSNDIGMNIVAEGVETKEQADYLLKCGCNVAQGYYYSKPVTINAFENLFECSKIK